MSAAKTSQIACSIGLQVAAAAAAATARASTIFSNRHWFCGSEFPKGGEYRRWNSSPLFVLCCAAKTILIKLLEPIRCIKNSFPLLRVRMIARCIGTIEWTLAQFPEPNTRYRFLGILASGFASGYHWMLCKQYIYSALDMNGRAVYVPSPSIELLCIRSHYFIEIIWTSGG